MTNDKKYHLSDLSTSKIIGESIKKTSSVDSITSFTSSLRPIIDKQIEVSSIVINNIEKFTTPMQKLMNSLSAVLTPIVKQVADNMPKMSPLFKGLASSLRDWINDPDSLYNWYVNDDRLGKYFWTIPYNMDSSKLKLILEKVNSEKQFDEYLIEYFTDDMIKNMFDDIYSMLSDNHKEIFLQIKDGYFCDSFALINVSLLAIVDQLCSFFIKDKSCTRRKNLFTPIIEEISKNDDRYIESIIISIVNTNLNLIFENVDFNKNISINTNKKVRRHLSQHGLMFSNKKIDSLMLINLIYSLLLIINNYGCYKSKLKYIIDGEKENGHKHSNRQGRFYLIKNNITDNK